MASRTILAETHVLGSIRGYGTVAASGGVAADESRELESFQFGDASTAERIARLETNAVMTGRALRSGRFAVSRMMPAGFDDAGRPTVEVITLLFEARDLGFVAGALERLASDAEFWRTARATVGDGARVDAEEADAAAAVRDARVLRHFDLWRAALRDGAVGVVSEGESDSVLALVAALDPSDRAQLRFGIGLLSLSAPVDLCSVALGTSLHGARPALRPAEEGAWHCGEESEYAAFRASAGGAHLPSIAEIESQGRTRVVRDEDAWRGRAHGDGASRRTEDGDTRARRLMPLAIGSAALSTVVLAFVLTMWTRRENAAAVEVPVFARSTSGGGAVRDGLTDPLGGEMPKAPAVVEEPTPEPSPEVPKTETPSEAGEAAEEQPGKAANANGDLPKGKPIVSGSDGGASDTEAPPAPSGPDGSEDGARSRGATTPASGSNDSEMDEPSGTEVQSTIASDYLSVSHRTLAAFRKDVDAIKVPRIEDYRDGPAGVTPQQRFENARDMARRALARVAVKRLVIVIEMDQALKAVARREMKESRDLVRDRNGFICSLIKQGPGESGQDNTLLNHGLVQMWMGALRILENRANGLVDSGAETIWNQILREEVEAFERLLDSQSLGAKERADRVVALDKTEEALTAKEQPGKGTKYGFDSELKCAERVKQD